MMRIFAVRSIGLVTLFLVLLLYHFFNVQENVKELYILLLDGLRGIRKRCQTCTGPIHSQPGVSSTKPDRFKKAVRSETVVPFTL